MLQAHVLTSMLNVLGYALLLLLAVVEVRHQSYSNLLLACPLVGALSLECSFALVFKAARKIQIVS